MDLGSVIWRSSGEDAPQISISRTIVAKIRNARMVSPRGSGSRNLSEQKRKHAAPAGATTLRKKKKISKAGSERLARPLTPASSLHLVQASVDEQAGNHQKHKARCSAQDFHQRVDLVHLGHELSLLRGHLGGRLIQEKLIVFLHGEGATVNQENDEDTGQDAPANQQPREIGRHRPPRY